VPAERRPPVMEITVLFTGYYLPQKMPLKSNKNFKDTSIHFTACLVVYQMNQPLLVSQSCWNNREVFRLRPPPADLL
jgi:hypothetical protein